MNVYNPQMHNRRSIRFKGYDYTQAGLYFITICCQNRACLFGEIENGKMMLNDAGAIANDCWLNIPNHFPNAILHEYVIMPNHVHGIIELVGANHHSPKTNHHSPETNQHSPETNQHSPKTNQYSPKTNQYSPKTNHHSPKTNHHSPNIPVIGDNRAKNVSVIGDNRAKNVSPLRSPSKTVGSVVRGFKIGVTKWMRQNTDTFYIWQRNYWEHIIRDDISYENISQYIINNPTKWNNDKLNPHLK